jgi:glycosyltransferase involved in cell wall biosynthesis
VTADETKGSTHGIARPLDVLFLPDYSAANAYQRALGAALTERGVRVAADATRPRRILPVLEAVRTHGRPDVVHLHWTEPYIARGASTSRLKASRTLGELRWLRSRGTAIVWTAHDLFRHDQASDPRELGFMRGLGGLSDAIVVHCAAARDALAETLGLDGGGRERLRVIPHGHYAGAYPDAIGREEARRRLELPTDARVVAFVGWVRPYKGVTELLEAFATLPDADARLVIAGKALDAGYADRVTALAAADDRVRLNLGFVPDDELQVYLRAADVVATPFLEIFTSGSVLLAMSFGKAVIAPRRGCVAETVDERGAVLYDADDPDGLQGALRAAMSADLEAMGRHNGERLPEFAWSRVAAATLETYREVVARRTSRSARGG